MIDADFDPRNVDDWGWRDYAALSASYVITFLVLPAVYLAAAWWFA